MKYKIRRDGEYFKTRVKLESFSGFGLQDKNTGDSDSTEIVFKGTENSWWLGSAQKKALKFLVEQADTILKNAYQFIYESREALEEVFTSFNPDTQEGFPHLNSPNEIAKYVNFSKVYIYPCSRDNYYFGISGISTWDSEHDTAIILHNLKVIEFGDWDLAHNFNENKNSGKSITKTYSLEKLVKRKKRLKKLSKNIPESEIGKYQEAFQFLIQARAIYGYRSSEVDLSDAEKAAYVKNLEYLTLSHKQLAEIPPSITQFVNLKSLNLRVNNISVIPDYISGLTSLESLNLFHNKITKFPTSFSDLINLEELDLSSNLFDEFPNELRKMTKLKSIDASDNQIKIIPAWIDEFQNLEGLLLSENQLEELPKSIRNIESLSYLKASYNAFTPQAIRKIESWFDESFVLELKTD